jgi:hypothetical protein
VADKVISAGDPLFGSTVSFVNVGVHGLNDAGQIGFRYTLADGRQGIAVANPVPEPGSAALLALGALGFVLRRRVR